MQQLLIRTLSGILFVLIIVGSILLSPYAFLVVFALLTVGSLFEFHRLTNMQEHVDVNKYLAMLGGAILFISSFLYVFVLQSYLIFFVYALFIMLVFFSELFLQKNNPIHNIAYFLFGQIFIALPFSILNFILYITNAFNPWLLIAMFALIWLYDSGAYLVGVSIGKHKMFPRISPKKSWEGFVGGVVVALLSGYFCSILLKEISLIYWLLFALIVVIAGTFGDFFESLIKRKIGIKDSGTIMPGHGGLLDRFDSMLFVAPAIYMYLSLLLA